MNPKQRVCCALNHRSPDRVAVDVGSTAVTGMHVTCVAELRDFFGLELHPVKVWEPYQMLGEIESDLLDALGADVVGLPAPDTMFGFRNEAWKEFRTPWGQDVLVSKHFHTSQDANGDLLMYPQGDRSAPPSGRMPADGYFFDAIIRQEPIHDEALNPEDNTEEFQILPEDDWAYFRTHADRLRTSGRAVVGAVPGTAFGDIALVPAPFLKQPKGIRSIEGGKGTGKGTEK